MHRDYKSFSFQQTIEKNKILAEHLALWLINIGEMGRECEKKIKVRKVREKEGRRKR